MTTISHVRGCNPQSMFTLAANLVEQNDIFSGRVEQMNRDVDAAMNGWQGQSAAAASARSLSDELAGNHIGQTVVMIADTLNTFGAELDGYRTSLLNIVDIDLPFAGMTVDDEGNVTPPKTPTGADNTGKPVVVILVQQGMQANADAFQARIKNLLVQFGDAEVKAAQAISADLQILAGYEKTPDGAPVRPPVQDIIDGRAQLPSDPNQLHDFWETLTPSEKDALWQDDQYLGNRDGLPAVDRDHYNRLKLQDELARAQAGDPAVKDKLGDLQTVAASVNQPDRYLLQLDSQSGKIPHAAIAAGNPDTASHVSTYVPGTGSRPAKMDNDMKRVDAMQAQAQASGAKNPSVVAWFGYDAPPGLTDATQQHYADSAAPALDRFQDGLRASHDGSPSYNSVIGHSYGTTVVGDAAGHGRSLNADAVAFVASPGTTLDGADEARLTGVPQDEVTKHVFATKAENDPIPELYPQSQIARYVPGLDDFGRDPTDSDYGAQRFASNPGEEDWYGYGGAAHSQYWDYGSKSLIGMGDIIAGHGDRAVHPQ
ncbi:alpha/beta hydrolase [Nocardia sp. BMG51109]|uniref:alpha/beta hydrolase n=1 Tax=Nocardia sp. BMG51109 TaxID=1056816 RepID=UPI000467E134|nr:alpha/beta hydrolase [Nocardia sp. BMG51109]